MPFIVGGCPVCAGTLSRSHGSSVYGCLACARYWRLEDGQLVSTVPDDDGLRGSDIHTPIRTAPTVSYHLERAEAEDGLAKRLDG